MSQVIAMICLNCLSAYLLYPVFLFCTLYFAYLALILFPYRHSLYSSLMTTKLFHLSLYLY